MSRSGLREPIPSDESDGADGYQVDHRARICMRILMVSNLWPPEVLGGAEQMAASLAERLMSIGHEVGVVSLGETASSHSNPAVVAAVKPFPYPIRESAEQPAVRRAIFHLADLHRPATTRALDAAVAQFRPDVVHTHALQGLSTTAFTFASSRDIPHVHTVHDYWLLCQRNSLVRRDGTSCDERCFACSAVSKVRNASVSRSAPDVLLAVSKAVAERHESLEWARNRMRVLYNPVEMSTAARPQRKVNSPITFVYLGRLARDKGLATLLSAFDRARSISDVELRLVVAGRGPLESIVRTARGVDYRGWVTGPEKEAVFAESDAVVVPSEWPDPAPLVANEARARGIAVIGAASGGIPELVSRECNALLFAAGDAKELSLRLVDFAAAPFAPQPEAAPSDWDTYLAGTLSAYLDACKRS